MNDDSVNLESNRTKGGTIARRPFGVVGDRVVELFTLTNVNGMVAEIITYGATLRSLFVPDGSGRTTDVVLGHDTFDEYLAGSPYFGATIGRVANRIADARFELNGKTVRLEPNDGKHHLHGGIRGWDKVVWEADPLDVPEGAAIELGYRSPDGDSGYPGAVETKTRYTLTNRNELEVEMRATTDRETVVNMAHHSYWNLAGQGNGTIHDHTLVIHADRYTPSVELVPRGAIEPVIGTPFDFTREKPIGRDLEKVDGTPIGFDHNWVVNGSAHAMRPVAVLRHPATGREMTLTADQPGVQFYSGNFLDGSQRGKRGTVYRQYGGLCLETQAFPNAINIPAWRSSVLLDPGQEYRHRMVHRFTTGER